MEKGSPWLVMFAAALCTLLLYCPCMWATDEVEEHSLYVYYVTPNNSTVQCPDCCPCFTLEDYVSNARYYFASNTTMVFLPGTHILEGNASVIIQNVTSLTLKGSTSLQSLPEDCDQLPSKIQCQGETGFSFDNVTDLHIRDLAFMECGEVENGRNFKTQTTIRLIHVFNLAMYAVTICNTTGIGIYADNILGHSSIQNSLFAYNQGTLRGGNALLYYRHCPSHHNSQLHIISSQFLYGDDPTESAFATGLAFIIECPNVQIHLDNIMLEGNKGDSGGNLAILFSHAVDGVVTIKNSHIKNGYAFSGGGLYLTIVDSLCLSKSLLHLQNTTFSSNYARGIGGAMYGTHHEAENVQCVVGEVLIENCTFENNSIRSYTRAGTAVHLTSFHIPEYTTHRYPQLNTVFRMCSFSKNFIRENVSITSSSALHVHGNPSIRIVNCNFTNNNSTAITAIHSNFIFEDTTIIKGNTGTDGGGLHLCENSFIFLHINANILFANNYAHHSGGAIYTEDRQCLLSQPPCFFQLDLSSNDSFEEVLETVHIEMIDNNASYAGTALYGGSVEFCYMMTGSTADTQNKTGPYVFETVFNRSCSGHDLSCVSSNPFHVCFCDNDVPNCNQQILYKDSFPGQTFKVPLVLVGQRNGTVPGDVRAEGHLGQLEDVQTINSTQCTELGYTIFSNQTFETLNLTTQQPNPYYRGVQIEVNLQHCPAGFELKQGGRPSCDCVSLLANNHIKCNITDQTIQRQPPLWIGFYTNTSDANDTIVGVIFHPHCPFYYCNFDNIFITANDTESYRQQCYYSRTGLLCGQCEEGLSQILGASRCWKCSNYYLLLLPLFALAGVALVFFLTLCNLTVTEGTINGLIFYANIVETNQAIFFSSSGIRISSQVLTVFIAWLNLDFGIPMCFYNGMDAYAKTWLQFAFPFYIWLIVVVITRRCALATRLATLVGRNAVKVLATLFLLSYAKLQQTIISALSPTILRYSGNHSDSVVWIRDANIKYLGNKHIFLFVFATFAFLCLFLPYTLGLLLIQCLQKLNFRFYFPITKFKPFFDAYTGPFKDSYQFWPGLLLLIRSLLLIIYVLNATGNPAVNLLATAIACFFIIVLGWCFRGVYKKWPLDILEASFFLNLGILSIATLQNDRYQSIYVHISISIAFLTFIGILIYHACKQTKGTQTWRKFSAWLARRRNPQSVLEPVAIQDESSEEMSRVVQYGLLRPVVSYDRYREPLLASEEED